jgi:hypothetical protein
MKITKKFRLQMLRTLFAFLKLKPFSKRLIKTTSYGSLPPQSLQGRSYLDISWASVGTRCEGVCRSISSSPYFRSTFLAWYNCHCMLTLSQALMMGHVSLACLHSLIQPAQGDCQGLPTPNNCRILCLVQLLLPQHCSGLQYHFAVAPLLHPISDQLNFHQDLKVASLNLTWSAP